MRKTLPVLIVSPDEMNHRLKLQPVPVTEDWAAEEYGLTGEELDRAADRLLKTGGEMLRSGKTASWDEFKKRRKP